MSGSGPKMTYISAQYRVRVEFTRADCLQSDPPDDIIERAKAILRRERAAGRVAFYRIFKTRFERMWAELRDAPLSEETVVAVTVVTGAPPMEGIELTPSSEPGELARLTIVAPPAAVGSWRFKLFKLTIGRYLRNMGITEVASPAHLHALWLRAQRGEAVIDAPLASVQQAALKANEQRPYHFLVGDQGAEIILVVNDVAQVLDEGLVDELVEAIATSAATISRLSGRTFVTLAAEIRRELASAGRGPERFGIDLPFVHLAAIADLASGIGDARTMNSMQRPLPVIPSDSVLAASLPSQPSAVVRFRPAEPPPAARGDLIKKRPQFGDGLVLNISSDQMTAQITACDEKALATWIVGDPRETWISYLKSQRISLQAALIDEILPLIETRRTLVGQIIARGRRAVAGSEPVFTITKPATVAATVTNAQSMRDAQQRQVVQRGQIIASFVWKSAPVAGMDVFGRAVAPVNPPFPNITLGSSVEARPDGSFVATAAGVPEITTDSIAVSPSLTLKGNVNLASGNLRFEGSATVTGSIERGATVEIKGDLTVLGVIEGGSVKVSGNLTVMGGIVMTARGGLRVGGQLTAAYIENAHVIAGGDITVTRAIASSHVSTPGNIAVIAPNGVIVGGETLAGGNVRCANLGRASAARTEVRVGIDAAREVRLGHRKRRRACLLARLDELSAMKKELSRRSAAQTTKRHHHTADVVVEGLDRLQAMVDRLDLQIKELSSVEAPRHDATITVTGILSSNSAVVVCGSKILVGADVAAVSLIKDPRGGGRMVSLSDAVQTSAAS